MSQNFKSWPLFVLLAIVSMPLVIMYVYLFLDTFTDAPAGSLVPDTINFSHWSFLWEAPPTGRVSIWTVTWNTLVFAVVTTSAVLAISLTSAYALSRINMPFRRFFLAGVIVLHAFPTITLIIAIFLILQFLGLYNTLSGVILVKAALELPFGIWIMKGFYDNVPWEIEMAGVQDGANRFTVWWKLVLPLVQPGIVALGVFSFLSAWSEFILPQVLAPSGSAQVLSTYLSNLILDDVKPDFNMFKAVGVFYAIPVVMVYLLFQNKLMNIYGGGSKG